MTSQQMRTELVEALRGVLGRGHRWYIVLWRPGGSAESTVEKYTSPNKMRLAANQPKAVELADLREWNREVSALGRIIHHGFHGYHGWGAISKRYELFYGSKRSAPGANCNINHPLVYPCHPCNPRCSCMIRVSPCNSSVRLSGKAITSRVHVLGPHGLILPEDRLNPRGM